MQQSWLANGALPIIIFFILFGLDMSLTPKDFHQVVRQQKAVWVGLVCQLILLPILALGLASVLPLDSIFSLSLVLIAASPGGATSNLITYYYSQALIPSNRV